MQYYVVWYNMYNISKHTLRSGYLYKGVPYAMKIAICDDEPYYSDRIKKYIMAYIKEKDMNCEVDFFISGKSLIEMGIEIQKYNIVFLDINMEELNGIQTAIKIRELSQNIFIVFITAYINYTLEGYKVDAIRYILKGDINFQATLYECMDAIFKKMNYHTMKIELTYRGGTRRIVVDRIFYIESRLHKLEFHVMEKEMRIYTSYNKLDILEQQLNEYGFIRIHKSFLINLKYLKDVINYKAIIINGIVLPVPKARFKAVKDIFLAYQGEL